MNWQLLLPLLVTSVVAILGWIAVHNFARKRDFENKKNELRIKYLVEVWRKLIQIANRVATNENDRKENTAALNEILADIQLFGTQRQVELIKNVLGNVTKLGKVSLDDLLDDLRRDLREQLKLEKIDGQVHFFREPSK